MRLSYSFRFVFPRALGRPFSRLNICLHIIFTLAAAFVTICGSAQAQSPKNILVLHGGWAKLPFNAISDAQIEKALGQDHHIHAQIFNEYIDEKRLDPEKIKFSELLRRKYAGQKFDVILSVSPAALNMLLAMGNTLWPGVPVVFMIVDYRMLPERLPSNFTGVTADIDFPGTLDLALRLQPQTQHVFYIVGIS